LNALAGLSACARFENTARIESEPDARYLKEKAPLAVPPALPLLQPAAHRVSPRIRKALDFIESHYMEPITLADVAGAALYSPCHFCRVFKEHVGVPFVTYLSRVRIRSALDMLSRSETPITDIALTVGFNDISHFERVFRAMCHRSPSQFRQEVRWAHA